MDEEKELTECPRCGATDGLMQSEGICTACYNEECEIESERQREMLDTLREMGN